MVHGGDTGSSPDIANLIAIALAMLAVPCGALAYPTGISGYSGVNNGMICTACHSGGAIPEVQLSGPATLTAGQSGSYTFTITGGAGVVGGFDLTGTNGVLTPGSGQQGMGSDLTHTMPAPFQGSSVSWTFMYQAPDSAGIQTLYAAGLSANGDNADLGDNAAATTIQIQVLPGPDAGSTDPGPGPGPTGQPDGGEPIIGNPGGNGGGGQGTYIGSSGSQASPNGVQPTQSGGMGCATGWGLGGLASFLPLVLRRRRALRWSK